MTWELARPSFWTDPRDPWAWQRALRRLVAVEPLPNPWSCWTRYLSDLLPRRAVGGLYGVDTGRLLGTGLLELNADGWSIVAEARGLVDEPKEAFQNDLAEWMVRRSAWVRLTLRRLAARRWCLHETALRARRSLRVGLDLIIDHPTLDVSDRCALATKPCAADVEPRDLSPLHAPLYLLASVGWLDSSGRPRVPERLSEGLMPVTAAAVLRALSAQHADSSGLVSVEAVARGLWTWTHGRVPPRSLAGWTDAVFGPAIASGAIEVHIWAPGQPRHGRGLFGDRDRKLVRWTVHDDFTLSPPAMSPSEVQP